MLYPTLNQPLNLLIIFATGFFCGILFDMSRILTMLSGKDKYSAHIFDFIASIASFCILFYTNLQINYGEFRLYILGVFAISFALERFLSKKLWTKLLSKWYSSIVGKRNAGKTKRQKMD